MENRKFTGKVWCRPSSSIGLDWRWQPFTVFADTLVEAGEVLQFRQPYVEGFEHVGGIKDVREVLPLEG